MKVLEFLNESRAPFELLESQYGAKTVVGSSLADEDEIVFGGGTHHEAIRMKFADFCRLESPFIVPLTRPT